MNEPGEIAYVPPKAGLVGKLSSIMEAVGRIPKNGYNDFHKYHYVMESDVLETVRHHFAANHIMLIPRVDGFEHLKLTEGGGEKAPNLLTTLLMTFSLLDGESGERLDFP
ncbi:MAG: ERF family protein, partial [Candidatus Hydrogenedentales bacterium]